MYVAMNLSLSVTKRVVPMSVEKLGVMPKKSDAILLV